MQNVRIGDVEVGDRFERLEVVGEMFTKFSPKGKKQKYFPVKCSCDAGVEFHVLASNLVRLHSKSCGCLQREAPAINNRTHGQTDTRLYNIWCGMKRRCTRSSDAAYHNYGGRGITICPQWRGDFTAFALWATSNGYAENLTIERVDVNGNYEPSNCTWITIQEQGKNRRDIHWITAFGEEKPLSHWERDPRCRVNWATIKQRMEKGWDAERAITTPPGENLVMVEAFGEVKNVREWSFDPRCLYGYAALMRRINAGWDPEDALMKPDNKLHMVQAFGEVKNIQSWTLDSRCVVNYAQLHQRLRKGWDAEAAIESPIGSDPNQSRHTIQAFGETKGIMDWTRDPRCEVDFHILHRRIRRGWEAERAIVTKKGKYVLNAD